MKNSTLYLKALANLILYLVGFLAVIFLVPKVLAFFLPFVIGLIISAIANPTVKFFEEKIKFKRKAMSAIMIVLIIALIIFVGYLLIAFLIEEGMGLAESLPEKWVIWEKNLENFGKSFSRSISNLPDNVQDWFANIGNTIEGALASFVANLGSDTSTSSLVSNISSGLGSVANVLIGVIMCVLSAYFFTAEHNSLVTKAEKYLPESAYSKCKAAYRGLKNAIGGYFKAQLKIELIVYVITVIGLLILKIDFSFIIALGIAVLDFLPFFGAGAIMVPWGIILFVNGEYFLAVGMFITWGVGQLVRQLVQPKIVGDNVGVAPLPTLILLFVGYKVMGVFGMVIAVPIAMIFISLYKEGLFSNLLRSVKILWDGISSFRRLP